MRGTQRAHALATHCDTVAEAIRGGEAFGDVEDAIDANADLTEDQKAALWLFAFSLRDASQQLSDATLHLAAVR